MVADTPVTAGTVATPAIAATPATLVSITAQDTASVPTQAVELLRASKRVLAIGHESPDADAFGSALGVALAVEWLGGRATPASSDPVPEMYRFMPSIERIRTGPEPDLAYDLIVVTDSGELSRVGRVAREHAELFGRVPILVIDHHASNHGLRRRRLGRPCGSRRMRAGVAARGAPGGPASTPSVAPSQGT